MLYIPEIVSLKEIQLPTIGDEGVHRNRSSVTRNNYFSGMFDIVTLKYRLFLVEKFDPNVYFLIFLRQ